MRRFPFACDKVLCDSEMLRCSLQSQDERAMITLTVSGKQVKGLCEPVAVRHSK